MTSPCSDVPRYSTGAEPKPAQRVSHVTLTQAMEITDANVAGNVHGGVIMRLAMAVAAWAVIRHAEGLGVDGERGREGFLPGAGARRR